MMMIECTYKFTPPDGKAVITIHGIQPYSPSQSRQVQVYKVNVPDEYTSRMGSDAEFASWASLIRKLAQVFCGGDESVAADRMVKTFDQRPSV